MNNSFEILIGSFLANKVGIDEAFLSEKLSRGLQDNIRHLQEQEGLHPAGTGNDKAKDPHQKMRTDKIRWLDKSNNNAFEQEFLELADEFVVHLNRTCYTGINAHEFHYAVYEKGSYYKRHTDQFKTDTNRKFSLINYLNEDWLEEDGGQLFLYQEEQIQKIQPQSKTAVFFNSEAMEHEVVLCQRSRMSISGWLKSV